MDWNLN